jgi:hypothetical protein
VLVLAGGSVAYANICAFDPVPAATLLFPFVAYNYDEGADGVNTLFAITNVSSDAQIVHLTLWTDYSQTVIDWNVLLTGYDVYTFDIRSILAGGVIPFTKAEQHSEKEGVIDQGPVSWANEDVQAPNYSGPRDDPNGENNSGMAWPQDTYDAFANGYPKAGSPWPCAPDNVAYPGNFEGLVIEDGILGFFKRLMQGSQKANDGFFTCDIPPQTPAAWNPLPLDQDNWWDLRDTTMDSWGYLTADVVYWCNKAFPDEEAYWDDIGYENVLIGDVIWVDAASNYSEVSNAVHIEADLNIDSVLPPEYDDSTWTFYSRYARQFDTRDYREPLPTAWAFRYKNNVDENALGDGSEATTKVRAFKTFNYDFDDFNMSVIPDLALWATSSGEAVSLVSRKCLAYTYYVWDNDENIDVTTIIQPPYSGGEPDDPLAVPNFLPLETQEVDSSHFNLVDTDGWLLFVWPGSNLAFDTEWNERPFYQTWMGVKYITDRPSGGGFSGAKDGAVIANYNCFPQQRLEWGLGINFQYVDPRYGGYVNWTGSSE